MVGNILSVGCVFRKSVNSSLAVVIALGTLAGVAARADTPTCNGRNVYPCSVGGTLLVLAAPANLVFSGGTVFNFGGGNGSFVTNPQNPGFTLAGYSPLQGGGPLLPSASAAFNLATVSGQATITGANASITCGVTGSATFSMTVSTPAGPLVLSCPKFPSAGIVANVTGQIAFAASSALTMTVTLSGTASNGSDTLTLNSLSVQAQIPVPPTGTSFGSRFVPVTPCRIADTRNPSGPFGGPALAAGSTRDFVIPNSACGIPSLVAAYSMNIAVVPHGALSFLTVWPSGQPQPLVASLNSDGRVKSNAAIIPAGANGAISIFATNDTDVVIDINGYFAYGPNTLEFYPVAPCRIVDTRNATGPLGGPSLASGGTRTFPILAGRCGIPPAAQAYSLNFAAVPHGPLGYLTAWPAGQPQPVVASLNAPTGTVVANAVIVSGGTNGGVNVYSTDVADLVIDVDGYFAPASNGGLTLYTPSPCRVLDSRTSGGSPISAATDVNVTASPCGVPTSAQAYVFNATVVPSGPLGYLTLWAQGQPQPLAASLNALDGAITSNLAIVPTNNGSISVFPFNPTHLVLDLFGYFAP